MGVRITFPPERLVTPAPLQPQGPLYGVGRRFMMVYSIIICLMVAFLG